MPKQSSALWVWLLPIVGCAGGCPGANSGPRSPYKKRALKRLTRIERSFKRLHRLARVGSVWERGMNSKSGRPTSQLQ